ncbi:MAG: GntR family transcriptional regulator [Oscillospiraceae bacterium]|nr:GntR family transcriptional regulator [Oscillospiraceae bacterium]MBQ7012763.1 GntR family transcriptional regulator [Oscillospiraceae bacterium]
MFDIDLMSRVPIYEQLYRKVVELILKGVLVENDKLPSVRSLATDLSVNPNTVAKAYSLLERDGIIHSLAGRGSFIAKPDTLLAQEHMLERFDAAALEALRAGIGRDILVQRLDSLNPEIKEEQTT